MIVNLFIWRPILAKITTLEEMKRHWSLTDLMDAHEALDIQQEAEYHSLPKEIKK